MGIVWEAYHKGVPLLRVPGITLESNLEPTKTEDVLPVKVTFHKKKEVGVHVSDALMGLMEAVLLVLRCHYVCIVLLFKVCLHIRRLQTSHRH